MISPIKNFDSYFWGLIFPAFFSPIQESSLKADFIEVITADEKTPYEVVGNLLQFIETGEADLLRDLQTWMSLTDKLSTNSARFFWYCYSLLSRIITSEIFVSGMSELYMSKDLNDSQQVEILDKCYHIHHDVSDGLSQNYDDLDLFRLVKAYVLLVRKGPN